MANGQPTPLLRYWPMVVVAVGLAVGYGTNTANLVHAEEEIVEHAERLESIEKNLGSINTSVATIVLTQEFTQEDLKDIKALLNQLSRQLEE